MDNKLKIYEKLQTIVPKENIKLDEPMFKHTSFKIGGNADFYITAKQIEEIRNINNFCMEQKINMQIIGNGSNLLILDDGLRGITIKIELDVINIKHEDEDYIVNVGAGTKIMKLAQNLKELEITGFEELAGIPGTIGGANRMNAGAYGKEFADILIDTTVLEKETGKIITLKKEEQNLGYRTSIFKNDKYIILEAQIKLKRGNFKDISEKMESFFIQRKEKQPLEYPSAGSTFKRGEGFITSKLIDECGLKGFKIGGAQISEKHAGFIINKDNATAKDVLELIEYTKKKVFERFGVQIEEEIEIIGKEELH